MWTRTRWTAKCHSHNLQSSKSLLVLTVSHDVITSAGLVTRKSNYLLLLVTMQKRN